MRCAKCFNFLEPDGECAFCPILETNTMVGTLRRCKKCLDVIDPMDDCPCCYKEQLCGSCQIIYHANLCEPYYKEKEDGEGEGAA